VTYVLAVLSEEHVYVRDTCYYKIILVVRSVNILQDEIFLPRFERCGFTSARIEARSSE